jgi:hypothetical protein
VKIYSLDAEVIVKAYCPPKIFEIHQRYSFTHGAVTILSRRHPKFPNSFPPREDPPLPDRRSMLVWRRGVVAGPVRERREALLLRLRRRGSAVPPHPSDPWSCYCISSDPLFHVLWILTVSCSLPGCSHGWNARMTAEEIDA